MKNTDLRYSAYLQILKEELVPAMGCTEPIALAYAAAVARKTLGVLPDKVEVAASGSIIKNVKSVIVPHTGHLKGIPAAAAAGIVAGDAEKKLEVISYVKEEQVEEIKQFLEQTCSYDGWYNDYQRIGCKQGLAALNILKVIQSVCISAI